MSGPGLLLQVDTRITCPKCEHEFSLEAGFAKQALETAEQASTRALADERERVNKAADARLQQQVDEMARVNAQTFKLQLDALKGQLTESQTRLLDIDKREAQLRNQEKALELRVNEAATARAAELITAERQAFEKRLSESTQQIQSLQSEQLQLRDERQRLNDEKAAMKLEISRQVDAKAAERAQAATALLAEQHQFEKAELQKKFDDVSAQLRDTQRKVDQGSQQLQGEVLELAIEEGLGRHFPSDTIEEVKKGQRGGDVIQRVHSRTGQPAGTILWETKRARDWSAAWLIKLKEDMRGCGADLGILVTMPSAVPRDWPAQQQFALCDDVWVCLHSVALQLAAVLRSALLDVHKQRMVSAGKGEKMEAVYDYVTSPQFAQKLRAVVDTFKRMREELEAERSQTLQRWARREKQLEGGVAALLGMGGEIQGLAQLPMPQLELEPPATD